jgi:hypothetical protein
MSYFKSRTSETSNTNTFANANANNFRNAFISSTSKSPILDFDMTKEAFPDLIGSNKKNNQNKTNNSEFKPVLNYSNVALKLEEKDELKFEETTAEILIPPGWVQYTLNKNTGKTTVIHSKKTNYDLVKEKRLLIESDPYFEWMMTLKELSFKWNKYKVLYDKIHGPGAYEEMYYSKPIYPELETVFNSDDDSECEYFTDYNYHYEDSS